MTCKSDECSELAQNAVNLWSVRSNISNFDHFNAIKSWKKQGPCGNKQINDSAICLGDSKNSRRMTIITILHHTGMNYEMYILSHY